jgi:prepilin-type N-terminal cleavage/methylation domain-containing protein/prepilin-type processing-associated H-X9-DG protein
MVIELQMPLLVILATITAKQSIEKQVKKMRTKRKEAFTLIELLVVISIIGILMGLLMPAVQSARESARRIWCSNNMRQIGIALHLYHDTTRGLPAGWIGIQPGTGQPLATGPNGFAWGSMLLPYLEEDNLVNTMIDFKLPVMHPFHAPVRKHRVENYICPSDAADKFFYLKAEGNPNKTIAELAAANYIGCFGTRELHECEHLKPGQVCRSNGAFYHNSHVKFNRFVDGLSNTIMVGERSSKWGYSTWTGVMPGGADAFARVLGVADHPPGNNHFHMDDFSSYHKGGAMFLFGDGSVQLLTATIDMYTLRGLATLNGGEVANRHP